MAGSDLQVMFEIDGKNNEENIALEMKLRKRCGELGKIRHNEKLAIWRFWSCRIEEFEVGNLNRAVSVDLWPQVVTDQALERAKEIMADPKSRQELEMKIVRKWDGIIGCFLPVSYFA